MLVCYTISLRAFRAILMSARPRRGDSSSDVVISMKEAVKVAIELNDIRMNAICKDIGMSSGQFKSWLSSRSFSDWDNKISEWLSRTQSQAIKEQSSRSGQKSENDNDLHTQSTKPSAKKSQQALSKLKEDLIELENYVPWNAVVARWDGKRAAWARKTNQCQDAATVAKQLIILEQAILSHAFEDSWHQGERDEWEKALLTEIRPVQVRALLHTMEDKLKWKALATQQTLEGKLKRLSQSVDAASLLGSKDEAASEQKVTLKVICSRLAHFKYLSAEELAADCFALAEHMDSEVAVRAIEKHLEVQRVVTQPDPPSDTISIADASTAQAESIQDGDDASEHENTESQLQEGFEVAGAKRARMIEKEAKFVQFKKRQQLHPEYAGIYAEPFLTTPRQMKQYLELLVFRELPAPECIVGMLHIQPHTNVGELRLMLEEELDIACAHDEELLLSRGVLRTSADEQETLMCPIQVTQTHKLLHPMFPLASHVLVVEGTVKPSPIDLRGTRKDDVEQRERAGLLCADVSGGRENLAIPAYNDFDDEPAPNDFTYVTHCVVNEGVRLLLGGPLREPWPCPYEDAASVACMPYDEMGRFLHTSVDSVYECTLASKCPMSCRNRLVQRGLSFRLEVYRCRESEGKFHKGWGVRSPDFIPRGSFLCEYIGEYISDDEAESRGMRYDKQKMSRLMDVSGDGKDVVRMCIDATNFSNLGRFLNHSCDPCLFKQRVFCDHNSRLPRVAFFALRDIPPMEELCYDYGYVDVPGKTMPCLCAAKNCKKLLY